MEENIVIKIENVTKEYKLGVITHRTFYREVQSFMSRVLRKEDPNQSVVVDRKRLHKGKFLALDNISLDINKGDVLGIVGKNGAGKSTLLKILSRVTAPTAGEVKIQGRIASLLEVGTGFHPELTGRENIFLNGAILGMRKSEIKRKFDEIVSFSGIEEFIDTPVKRYSSGMYVRLAFAVAAHLEPEILIVDEVLAVGDHEFQEKCLGKMGEVSKSGRTVLFVSHNMDAVQKLCSKAVYLENGKITKIGDTYEITQMYMNKTGSYSYKSANSNNPVYFEAIKIIDDSGHEKNVFDYEENVQISITYVIKTKLDKFIVWFDIRKDAKIVFASSDCDQGNLDFYDEREAGIYTTIIKLPNAFFNKGLYELVLGINGYMPLVEYDRVENITFLIDENTNYTNPEFYDRIGIIKPLFSWHTKKIK